MIVHTQHNNFHTHFPLSTNIAMAIRYILNILIKQQKKKWIYHMIKNLHEIYSEFQIKIYKMIIKAKNIDWIYIRILYRK